MIEFLLNGNVAKVAQANPNTTLLQYLRETAQLKGTKEGCGSGDCGACTVLLGSWQNEQWQFEAINACLALLASAHGKHVLTVEALNNSTELHPVQQAMVDCHGSQCGFCTPGIVMSLTANYMHGSNSDHAIEQALSGNLCRCTGYKPIINAAKQAWQEKTEADDSLHQQFGYWQPESSPQLGSGEQAVYVPQTESELQLLLTDYPEATLVAGGTDINLTITQQFQSLGTIIHTRQVKELQHIQQTESWLCIGAAVSYEASAKAIGRIIPTATSVFERIGSLQIRQAATLAGNIANASPIGDGAPMLMAMNAVIEIGSSAGNRKVAIEDFITGYKQTCLRHGEYIRSIQIPLPNDKQQFVFHKLSKRFEDDISTVLVAARFEVREEKIVDACIAFGGMAATPVKAAGIEEQLIGKSVSGLNANALATHFTASLSPITDVRASANYRSQAANNLVRKALLALQGQAPVSVWEATV